jgi:hypothetical protein
VRTPKTFAQLLFQSSRDSVPTGGQRTDDDSFVSPEVQQNRPGNMTEPTGDLMPLDGIADRFGDYQTDPWSVSGFGGTPRVHDDVRLRRSHPVLDGGAELRRPCHPELSREHAA